LERGAKTHITGDDVSRATTGITSTTISEEIMVSEVVVAVM
jgi:hypothetical protein